MKALDDGQRATYDDDGCVIVEDLFPLDELQSIDAEITRLRQDRAQQHGQRENIILQLGLRSAVTRQLCQDDRLLYLIQDVVTPGIAIYSAKMVEKPPFDETVCHWHQDDAYYQQQSLSACRMSVWIPLTDCSQENGCLWVVPGSHKQGLQPWSRRKDGFCNLAFRDGEQMIEGAVPVPIRAGSVLLFHALLWHRSLANRTAQTRRSFIISYQDAVAGKGNGAQHRILRAA